MFPIDRPRRLRHHPVLRELVRETTLFVSDLILPLFVRPGRGTKKEIASMPGNFQLSVDRLVEEVGAARDLGIKAFILFGIPAHKDATGSSAWHDDGIVQQALRALRETYKDSVLLITDECFCEYTDHGHCGVIADQDVDNDATLPLLAKQAVSFAKAGADFVAPSDMMDGRVAAIRRALDESDLSEVGIMAYSAKFASGFYGPFREAAESTPQFGDRRTYQMDPANIREAIREIELDIEEGADIVMVKPALAYLDVIRAARDRFDLPIAAYNVSGEYAMVKAAAERGWIDGTRVMNEILTAIKRAGADLIITYFSVDFATAVR